MTASPIRDSAGKLAITPGVWVVSKMYVNVVETLGGSPILYAENRTNADRAFLAEAGTVTNATGRTPAELAALVRELSTSLRMIASGRLDRLACKAEAHNALAKSEGV
jgi:hypothetical protein